MYDCVYSIIRSLLSLSRQHLPNVKIDNQTPAVCAPPARITWYTLPFDIVYAIGNSLELRDLIAIQYLSESCEEAANEHFKRKCSTLYISRTTIGGMLAGMSCPSDFAARVALLMTRVGSHVLNLTVNFNTTPDESSSESDRQTALLEASVECAVISLLVCDLCPSLKQFTLNGPHRNEMQQIVRVFTAPVERTRFEHMQSINVPIEPLVKRYKDMAASINQRIKELV